MAQVLTSEGLTDYLATGKIPEFVKPETGANDPKTGTDDAPKDEAKTEPVKAEAEIDDGIEDEDGLTAAERKAYSEKITKKISAKNRALKAEKAYADIQRREREAAERKASELEKKYSELEARVKPLDDTKGPKREDFGSDAEWWDAKIEFVAERKAEQRLQEMESQREAQRIEKERLKRIENFAKTVDDYNETVAVLSEKPVSKEMIDYAAQSEMAPQVVYYLGKHPDELDRILSKPKQLHAAELGKIEAKLEREAEKPKEATPADKLEALKAPISRAPAPITPISDSATPVQKDPSKMSFEELRIYNREQRRKAAQR